jgi:hypothetical protein
MSLRSGTQKAKKFGTPTTPTTPSTPKAPTPKQPKIIKTVSPSTQVITSGQPKKQRPSPRTQQHQVWEGGELKDIGFQTTPTQIEANIQQRFRNLTSGFASTLGLDFNAMDATVKKIQSLFTEKLEADYYKRRGYAFDYEKRSEEITEEIEEIETQEVEKQIMNNVNDIIGSINNNEIIAPDWFQQSISWVQSGHMSPQEFLNSYEHLTNQGIIKTRSEEIIEIPQILPEVLAEEEQIMLSNNIIQILNDIENGVILVPDWFRNNIEWVQNGHISEEEFMNAYNYLVEQQIAHPPEQTIDDSIKENMVTQQIINFNIVNGRAIGSIKFIATNNFNSYYYGKNIINIIQFKDPNGANILTTVKTNNLNFTETERDEIINYDEDMQGNTRATVESFVWEWIDKPLAAFSKKFSFEISEKEPPKPLTTGFMGAGVAGAIAGLILIGFIADHKVGK